MHLRKLVSLVRRQPHMILGIDYRSAVRNACIDAAAAASIPYTAATALAATHETSLRRVFEAAEREAPTPR